jgi:hypothetical protein
MLDGSLPAVQQLNKTVNALFRGYDIGPEVTGGAFELREI